MDDIEIAAALKKIKGIQVMDATKVKIEHVGGGKALLDKKINFGSLKPAVMINNTLFIGAPLPHRQSSLVIRQ